MKIAVAPLDWNASSWQMPAEFSDAINEKLIKKFLDTGRFVVLERDALDALLKEKEIKEESTGQSQKGKIVAAQSLVAGKVTDFSLDNKGAGAGVSVGGVRVGGSVQQAMCKINVRIINVDTSEVVMSETDSGTAAAGGLTFSGSIGSTFSDFAAFEKSPLGKAVTTAIDKVVERCVKKLDQTPWQAQVADFDADSKEVFVNAGSDMGVVVGDTFEVHRVTRVIKDPETGEVIGKKTAKVGKIRVTSVEKKVAFCSVVEGEEFQTGDIVKEIK
jgi:curli biogenesis system outer membrane secretion channel CsgG